MHKFIQSLQDTSAMINRSLNHTLRHVEIIIITLVMPLMQFLLLIFVFSGSMQIEGFAYTYLDYVVPGILLMSIASSASMSASSIKEDMVKGIVDRFRSMDISKGALLHGHVVATLLRCVITASIIVVIALLLGFRAHIPFINYVILFGIIFMFTLLYTWLSIAWGLFSPSLEAVSALTYVGMFLPYVGSCFVPVENLPTFTHGFARYQPFTPIADSIRGLLLNMDTGNALYIAFAWCIGLTLLFYFLSLHLYHKQQA